MKRMLSFVSLAHWFSPWFLLCGWVSVIGIGLWFACEVQAQESKVKAGHRDCDPTTSAGMNSGGTQYKCTPQGTWAVDQTAMEYASAETKHRSELYWALRTRVLTEVELDEVRRYDYGLLVHYNDPFNPVQVNREYLDALEQQFRLRALGKVPAPVCRVLDRKEGATSDVLICSHNGNISAVYVGPCK